MPFDRKARPSHSWLVIIDRPRLSLSPCWEIKCARVWGYFESDAQASSTCYAIIIFTLVDQCCRRTISERPSQGRTWIMESTHFELRAVLCTRFLSLPRFARWKESEGVARSVFLLFALPHQCCIHPLYPCVCPLVSTTITALDTTITTGKKKNNSRHCAARRARSRIPRVAIGHGGNWAPWPKCRIGALCVCHRKVVVVVVVAFFFLSPAAVRDSLPPNHHLFFLGAITAS